VQREIETGISQPIPLRVRHSEGLRTVREIDAGEWIFPIAVAVVLMVVAILILRQEGRGSGARLLRSDGLPGLPQIRTAGDG